MKIAYIGSRGFPGFNGGVEKSLEEVCPRLAEKGHTVTVYCSEHVKTAEPVYKGVILERMPAIPSKHFETISRVALSSWDALFKRYDIVHFQSIGPALMSWVTRLNHCKTVVTVHGLDWQRAKWNGIAKFSLQIGECSGAFFPHHTVVVSKQLQRYYRKKYKRNTTYIPNGATVYPPLPPDEIKEKWSLGKQEYILFASRLVPEKECHTLIRAYQKLKTNKKLVIAGGSWHSDNYVSELKKMAEDNPNILFVGWAEGKILQELFSNAYLYCLPSQIEGLSLSLLEAMSHGVCPLVSDIPENTDVIETHGAVFEMGNSEALRKSLDRLLRHPEETGALGREALQHVKKEYSWDRCAEGLEDVYKTLVN